MLEWVYSNFNKKNTEVLPPPPPSHNPSPFYTHPSHTCQFIPGSGTCDRQGARRLRIRIRKRRQLFSVVEIVSTPPSTLPFQLIQPYRYLTFVSWYFFSLSNWERLPLYALSKVKIRRHEKTRCRLYLFFFDARR
jgi:hypothetical protein